MMKWIFGLLLLVNLLFFAVMRWGSALTVDASSPPVQAALNAEKIKLLSPDAVSSPASAIPAAMPVAQPAMPASPVSLTVLSGKLSCMEWGEFSAADLSRAEKALEPLKLGTRLKQRQVEYTNVYWVYFAPMKTHAQVEQKIAQLKAHGIGDYFVMQEAGPLHNAISLGVFKTEEAAKKYLAKLRGQGVKTAVVGERSSKLKFTVLVLNDLESEQSSKVSEMHKGFPDSELKSVTCSRK